MFFSKFYVTHNINRESIKKKVYNCVQIELGIFEGITA